MVGKWTIPAVNIRFDPRSWGININILEYIFKFDTSYNIAMT